MAIIIHGASGVVKLLAALSPFPTDIWEGVVIPVEKADLIYSKGGLSSLHKPVSLMVGILNLRR